MNSPLNLKSQPINSMTMSKNSEMRSPIIALFFPPSRYFQQVMAHFQEVYNTF